MIEVKHTLLNTLKINCVDLYVEYPNGNLGKIEADPSILLPHVNEGDYVLNYDELTDICIRVNEELQNIEVKSEADKKRMCKLVFDKCNFRIR